MVLIQIFFSTININIIHFQKLLLEIKHLQLMQKIIKRSSLKMFLKSVKKLKIQCNILLNILK